ncbi:RING finger and CHY zinc finger domain-containing protein 1-like isoform X2 [Portunus trituberculatus]|uniref:RING finger and CHY zinc finger domain-containing protein 1-like isoform X2 n=1 Tax=Portunus trituberculatus TaxID=210409 RepID=UPI001E1D204C|nr:RING finger and CHY zinc finger domain-containing protein 1-like isoform X2 [Portunus trituberculatus]
MALQDAHRTISSNFTLGCEHYRRKCKLVSPCCKQNYICRFCHDESENHPLDRPNITEVECLVCEQTQPLSQNCGSCGIIFGNYFCEKCKLFGDEDLGMYHCDGCGLCRVGGKDKFFHCDICDLCLPTNIRTSHKCIAKMGKGNCPVCLEDIHTSRNVSHIPPCSHLIHRPCFDDLISAGFYACPVCGASMFKMDEECLTMFHVLGNKCLNCGSYNTVRAKGGLCRREKEQTTLLQEDPEYQGSESRGAEGFSNESDDSGTCVRHCHLSTKSWSYRYGNL